MLGRHLARVGGISCLLLVCVLFGRATEKETLECHLAGRGRHQLFNNMCFPFPGQQKKKAMLGRHLAGVGGISCFLFLTALSLAQGRSALVFFRSFELQFLSLIFS